MERAQDNHLERIVHIWQEGWYKVHPNSNIDASHLEQFEKNFKNRKYPYDFWIIKEGDEISGWVSILPAFYHPMKEKSEAEISIYIDKNESNRGLGTMITSFVLDEVKYSAIKRVWAFVSKHNFNSKHMCEKAGLTVCGSTSEKYLLIKEFNS